MDVESVDMVSMAQRKTTTFTLRMDPEVKQASEKGAADDRRSLSSLIEILLIDYCKKRGRRRAGCPRSRGGNDTGSRGPSSQATSSSFAHAFQASQLF